VFTITSCTKSNTAANKVITPPTHSTQPTGPGTVVYVSGNVTGSQSISIATCWKNGVAVALADSSSNSYAYALAVSDTDVYVAGSVNNNATYWKNGKATALAGGYLGVGTGIAVNGTDVYVAGCSIVNNVDVATIWKNGVATILAGDANSSSFAVSVAISGSDVYVAGYMLAAGNAETLCYWKNGVIAKLSTNTSSGFATYILGSINIAVLGSNVYVTGAVYNTTDTQLIATYWKNGTDVPLATDGNVTSSGVNAITTNGTDVYTAGFDGYTATYWKNGSAVSLNNGVQQYNANAITVNNSIVYVAGYAGYGSTNAVYWKGGTLVPLSTRNSVATGIGVVQH